MNDTSLGCLSYQTGGAGNTCSTHVCACGVCVVIVHPSVNPSVFLFLFVVRSADHRTRGGLAVTTKKLPLLIIFHRGDLVVNEENKLIRNQICLSHHVLPSARNAVTDCTYTSHHYYYCNVCSLRLCRPLSATNTQLASACPPPLTYPQRPAWMPSLVQT